MKLCFLKASSTKILPWKQFPGVYSFCVFCVQQPLILICVCCCVQCYHTKYFFSSNLCLFLKCSHMCLSLRRPYSSRPSWSQTWRPLLTSRSSKGQGICCLNPRMSLCWRQIHWPHDGLKVGTTSKSTTMAALTNKIKRGQGTYV